MILEKQLDNGVGVGYWRRNWSGILEKELEWDTGIWDWIDRT